MKLHRRASMRLRTILPREPFWRLRFRDLQVLSAVQDGLVDRNPLYGDLAPWMFGTQQVSWSVTLLVLHRMVRLDVFGFGPPQITARGRRLLDDWVDLHVVGNPR